MVVVEVGVGSAVDGATQVLVAGTLDVSGVSSIDFNYSLVSIVTSLFTFVLICPLGGVPGGV